MQRPVLGALTTICISQITSAIHVPRDLGQRYPNGSTTAGLDQEGPGSGVHAVSSLQPTCQSGVATSANDNATAGEPCWSDWSAYWSMSTHLKSVYTTFTTTRTIRSHQDFLGYTTAEVVTTNTAGNGNFATRTYVDTLSTEWAFYTTEPTSTVATETYTSRISSNITAPSCALPTYVPQCQASWSQYATGAYEDGLPEPPCTQASISGALCSTYVSTWLEVQTAEMGEIEGKVGMQLTVEPVTFIANGTQPTTTTTSSYYWPTSSTVAPGCSVGCQSCRVSGSRVKLLHWPPEPTGWHNGTFFASSTQLPNATLTAPATLVTEGVTLTSPTVYISFDRLHASNSCDVIGKTLSNIIVAITNSATLSSLYGWDRYRGLQQTASFNFTDLYVIPVPSSIYQSQPRCASSSINMWYYSCLPHLSQASEACASVRTSGYDCPRTLPYEPVLALPAEVRDLQPEWSDCIGGVIGVYDPPMALQAATAVIKPTAPGDGSEASQQAPSIAMPTVATNTGVETTKITSMASATPATPASSVIGFAAPTQAFQTTTSAVASSTTPNAGPADGHDDAPAGDVETAPGSSVNIEAPISTEQEQSLQSQSKLSPTDALGVLTQALTKSTSDVVDTGASPTAVQSGAFPSIFTSSADGDVGAHTPSATVLSGPAFTLGVPHEPSDTASFAYDPASSAFFTADAHSHTVIQVGTSIIVLDPSTTAILQAGQPTSINSKPMSVGPEGMIYGSTTISLATPVTIGSAAMVITAGGGTYTLATGLGGIVVQGNSNAATLSGSGTKTIDGQAFAVGEDGHIVVDGTSYTVPHTSIIADKSPGVDPGSEMTLPLASTTLIIQGGSQTAVEGTTYSVRSGGGAVIVHGNSTTLTVDAVQSSTQSLPLVVTALATSSVAPVATSVDGPPYASSTAASTADSGGKQARWWLSSLPFVLACGFSAEVFLAAPEPLVLGAASPGNAMTLPFARTAQLASLRCLNTAARPAVRLPRPCIVAKWLQCRGLSTTPLVRQETVPLRRHLKDEAKRKKAEAKSNVNATKKSKLNPRLEKWELTVGVEIHAELNTACKLFSSAPASIGDGEGAANSRVALFDAATPGTQPQFQHATLLPALRAAIALGCEVQRKSGWDRKHYFHWDQPNGYQITQYYEPFAKDGTLTLTASDGVPASDLNGADSLKIGIKQIQMEQDTAKTTTHGVSTYHIDFNRAGHPLIEVITLPHIHSPQTAAAVVRKIQAILKSIDACAAGMELGGLRADVNVSVRERGTSGTGSSYSGVSGLGQRTEIKNLSSFKAVEDAIIAERDRQISVLEAGGVIEGETRGWTLGAIETTRLRGKEGEVDYRYMPDADLPPLVIGEDLVNHLRMTLPELPDETVERVQKTYGLSEKDAKTIVALDDGDRLDFLEETVELVMRRLGTQDHEGELKYGKLAGNWVLHEIGGLLTPSGRTWEQMSVTPLELSELLLNLLSKQITARTAKQLLVAMHENLRAIGRESVEQLIDDGNLRLRPLSEDGYIALAQQIMDESPDMVAAVREKGQKGKIMWFVGQMVRRGDEGTVEPEKAKEVIEKLLEP
ncbi:Glutamyl-tRNA(Gln) amidotransferase subunit B, mitochondrial [Fulvia fulva]|nr:Glutamyl-tRNA(Gln) amidotransferase subunit B, mitochondrial [Fulvia fulva]